MIGSRFIISPTLPNIKHPDRIRAHPLILWLSMFLPITPYVELTPGSVTHCYRYGGVYYVSAEMWSEMGKSTAGDPSRFQSSGIGIPL